MEASSIVCVCTCYTNVYKNLLGLKDTFYEKHKKTKMLKLAVVARHYKGVFNSTTSRGSEETKNDPAINL